MKILRIGQNVEWNNEYVNLINPDINNNTEKEDTTLCFWYMDGSDYYNAEGTIERINNQKLKDEELDALIKAYGFTKEDFEKLNNAVKDKSPTLLNELKAEAYCSYITSNESNDNFSSNIKKLLEFDEAFIKDNIFKIYHSLKDKNDSQSKDEAISILKDIWLKESSYYLMSEEKLEKLLKDPLSTYKTICEDIYGETLDWYGEDITISELEKTFEENKSHYMTQIKYVLDDEFTVTPVRDIIFGITDKSFEGHFEMIFNPSSNEVDYTIASSTFNRIWEENTSNSQNEISSLKDLNVQNNESDNLNRQ